MRAIRLPNGRLLISKRAEGPNGMIGEGMVEVGSGDPVYEAWLPFAEDDVAAPTAPQPSQRKRSTGSADA
jgi:hypothetical protein